MGWNPETYDFCFGCSCYESVGTYIYELSSLAKRKCKHLARCRRVAKFVENKELGVQMSVWDQATRKEG